VNRFWTRPAFGVFSRWAAGGILLAAGLSKVRMPAEEFAYIIESYRLIPFSMTLPLARVVPWLEIMAGASLLAGWLTRAGAAGALGLFMMFIGALGSALLRGIDLNNCGCFGPYHGDPLWVLAMDTALGLLCLGVALHPCRRFSLDALFSGKDTREEHPAH
jgi:uncharacterized membrane protein YphA (DoxX/SURF4 family)